MSDPSGADADDRVPVERVRETAAVFEELDADATERVYEGWEHAVHDDEVAFVEALLDGLVASGERGERPVD